MTGCPRLPEVQWWVDGETGTALADLAHEERIPLRGQDGATIRVTENANRADAIDAARDAAHRLLAREALRLVVLHTGQGLTRVAASLARGGLPDPELRTPGWSGIVSLAREAAQSLA